MKYILILSVLLLTLGSACSSTKQTTLAEKTKTKTASPEEMKMANYDAEQKLLALEAEMEYNKATLDKHIAGTEQCEQDLVTCEQDLLIVKNVYSDYQLKLNKIKQKLKFSFPLNTIEEEDGQLVIILPNMTLYPAGGAELTLNSLQLIQELALIIKSNPGLQVHVEGHTDDTPLQAGSIYADNWDLSFTRSVLIVRELAKYGVDPMRLSAAGRGEFAPRNTHDSVAARIENRRTEIIILPEVSKLVKATSEL